MSEVFRTAATTFADRIAVVDDAQQMTYRELDRAADRFAAGLVDRGLTDGCRVIVHLPNRVETVVVLLGLLRSRAVPVLALPAHRESEIVHLHRVAQAYGYIVGGDLPGYRVETAVERLRSVCALEHVVVVGGAAPAGTEPYGAVSRDLDAGDIPSLPDPAAPALFLLSGGSTGLPKLIPRTHDDYAYNARAMAELCRIDRDDAYLAVLPIAHNFALACPGVLGVFGCGGRVVLSRSANPSEAFEIIARENVTVTSLVPSLATLWAEAVDALAPDVRTIRLVQVGGAKLTQPSAHRINVALPGTLQQVYGMAEGLLVATRLDDPDPVIESTQGRPLSPGDELRIVDGNDDPVPPGETGELLVRGPYTLRGYFRAGQHNARAFTADGFYRTGDLVRLTPEGNLVVAGRADDIINRGGEKVDPTEIETHLRTHPDIEDAVVVPVPDPAWGQQVTACLRLRDAADTTRLSPAALGTFLRGRGVAAYKWPQRIHILDQLPLTALGKPDRRRAARMVTEQRQHAATPVTEGS
ncbi:(2,3-dihydroxybenzoyl)adenylate synthase [Nocardia transvalensis]|uniref:(2,3-dihydroxybenzoyl)adenylate synthase n=1 Tax=Nocardia transvalensis TaxID=37333 RepID=UPI002B4B1EB3|nr:AMP-binding protein [Nocardia transvalensis]